MSFLTGAPASADAHAMEPVRVLSFDQARLREAIETDADIRRAMESSLNLNLVGKLVRSNEHEHPRAEEARQQV
jgi:CRP-like cAMP-binding protein